MTMVRKSIITSGAWHFYYTLTLLLNWGVGYILIQNLDPVKNPAGIVHMYICIHVYL
jgi:hypothetical protein